MTFERQPSHWLYKHTPEEWIQAGLAELRRAESALKSGALPAAYAGLKRASGMALNAVLVVRPDPAWGRSYVEHLQALAEDSAAPAAVRDSARIILGLKASPGEVVSLRSPGAQAGWVEAAKTVMAHSYAIVHGRAGAVERRERAAGVGAAGPGSSETPTASTAGVGNERDGR